MKYQVFDNDRPADCDHHQVDTSWNRSLYNSFEEAVVYARMWLGRVFGRGYTPKVNVPWDYSGEGDMIEIREIKD